MSEQEEKYQVGRVAWEIGNAQVRREYPALPMVTWAKRQERVNESLENLRLWAKIHGKQVVDINLPREE